MDVAMAVMSGGAGHALALCAGYKEQSTSLLVTARLRTLSLWTRKAAWRDGIRFETGENEILSACIAITILLL